MGSRIGVWIKKKVQMETKMQVFLCHKIEEPITFRYANEHQMSISSLRDNISP